MIAKSRKPPRRAQDAALARRVARAFGVQLKRVRRERGWKQDAFAEALGVSRTTASNIERGEQRIFLDQVYRAASILRVPIDDLLPSAHVVTEDTVVHAAADAPLTRTEAHTLARTVEDVQRGIRGGTHLTKLRHTTARVERRTREG